MGLYIKHDYMTQDERWNAKYYVMKLRASWRRIIGIRRVAD